MATGSNICIVVAMSFSQRASSAYDQRPDDQLSGSELRYAAPVSHPPAVIFRPRCHRNRNTSRMSQSDDQLSASQLRAKVLFVLFSRFSYSVSYSSLSQHAVGGNQNHYSGIVSCMLVRYNIPIVVRTFSLSNRCFLLVHYH